MFAPDFDTPTLIIVYSMLILGGAGSLGGVILGALVVNVSLEVLRTPNHASWIFYGLLVVTLVAKLRPWRWLAGVIAGTRRSASRSTRPSRPGGRAACTAAELVGGTLGSGLQHWVVLPANPNLIGNVAFVILVLVVLWLTTLHGWLQKVALAPDALPGGVRLGEPARRRAEHHAPDPRRRDPDRPHERAAAGAARQRARGDRLMPGPSCSS